MNWFFSDGGPSGKNQLLMGKGIGFFDTRGEALRAVPIGGKIGEYVKVNNENDLNDLSFSGI